jgi:hypothetical protein
VAEEKKMKEDVKKDGVKALSSEKPKAEHKDKKEKKPKFHHTMIEHHDDGSHTVRHVPHAGGEKPPEEVSYAAKDLDGVHDGLEQNLGTPNAGEMEAEAAPAGAGPAGPAAAAQV